MNLEKYTHSSVRKDIEETMFFFLFQCHQSLMIVNIKFRILTFSRLTNMDRRSKKYKSYACCLSVYIPFCR